MAFRELTMIDVKEVLRRWSAGQSDRKIGREAGARSLSTSLRQRVGEFTELPS